MVDTMGSTLACRTSIRTDDVDQARRVVDEQFYGSFLKVLKPSPSFAASFDVIRTAGVTVGDLRCGTDIRMGLGELGAYHVDVPLSGRLIWRQGTAGPTLATTARAAVFQPGGDTVLERWEADCRLLAVKIPRPVLEAEFERMTDVSLRTPLRFAPDMDISAGFGRSWVWLVRMIADNGVGLAENPLVAPRLREGLVRGLLVSANHPHRDRLTQPGRAVAAPKAIRRVVAAIRAEPERPYTVGRLAQLAGVSIRSLQEGFQRHMGVSPKAFLRDVRLAQVHQELQRTPPGTTGVTEVAHRWGFVHPGRFAQQYRAKYGVNPSNTLREG